MAITAVGTDGHTECTASGTAVTSALPTGITDNDLVLIEVSHGSGTGGSGTTITTPSGWNLLTQVTGTSTRIGVFWRFFVTGDTAPSFTLGTSRFWCTHSTAFRGVDTTSPINQQSALNFASASSYTSPTITPAVNNCMIVACWGGKVPSGATQTITVASGWTDTSGITQSAVAAQVNQWADLQYLLQSTAAAVSEAVTVGSAQNAQVCIIALAPAAGATQVTLNDSGAAADSVAVTAAVPLADSGTATDELDITAAIPLADSGTATDSTAVSIPVLLADGGAAADSLQVTVATPLTDGGAATDGLAVTAQISLFDTGTAADSINVGIPKPLGEVGSATDTATVSVAAPLADTGSGTDTLAVTAASPLADQGTASDSIIVQQIVAKPLADTGAAADSLTVSAAVPLADFGTAADSLAVQALLALSETGTAVDSFSVQIVGPGAPTPGTLTAADQPLATLGTTSATGTLTATDKVLATLGSSSVVAVLTAAAVMAGGPS